MRGSSRCVLRTAPKVTQLVCYLALGKMLAVYWNRDYDCFLEIVLGRGLVGAHGLARKALLCFL